jgi:NitT/TauT family transport system ATP-binding protein
MIRFDHVSKCFIHNGGPPTTVLDRVNLSIEEGEMACVLGPSGCGKTTLLNLIAGFLFPNTGQVRFEGNTVRAPGPERGVVFQDANLFPWLSVFQNVAFGLKRQGVKGRRLTATTDRYLERMGLSEHAQKYPFALSGGMRQRVAIARVLALEPKVLLMDEPFSALDAGTRERLQDELLRVWADSRRTVLYITHSVEEAAYLADRIIVMGQVPGGVVEDLAVDLPRPRQRTRGGMLALQETLRGCLGRQPCCIRPQSIESN